MCESDSRRRGGMSARTSHPRRHFIAIPRQFGAVRVVAPTRRGFSGSISAFALMAGRAIAAPRRGAARKLPGKRQRNPLEGDPSWTVEHS